MAGSNCAMFAQRSRNQAPTNSKNSLIRSQRSSGFRVGRSSSRSRLFSWVAGAGIPSCPEGAARLGVSSGVMSALLHGPGTHDGVEQGLVVAVAVRFAPQHEQVQLVGSRVDDGDLGDPDHRAARRRVGHSRENHIERHLASVKPTLQYDVLVGKDFARVRLNQPVHWIHPVPQAAEAELVSSQRGGPLAPSPAAGMPRKSGGVKGVVELTSRRGPGFPPSTNGLHFANDFPAEPLFRLGVGRASLPIGNAADGLCGGMVFTARDLFQYRLSPPPDRTPPPRGTWLFRYLLGRLFASFNLPTGPLR